MKKCLICKKEVKAHVCRKCLVALSDDELMSLALNSIEILNAKRKFALLGQILSYVQLKICIVLNQIGA